MKQKRGEGSIDFKKGKQAGSRGGALKKKGGVEPPYELYSLLPHSFTVDHCLLNSTFA